MLKPVGGVVVNAERARVFKILLAISAGQGPDRTRSCMSQMLSPTGDFGAVNETPARMSKAAIPAWLGPFGETCIRSGRLCRRDSNFQLFQSRNVPRILPNRIQAVCLRSNAPMTVTNQMVCRCDPTANSPRFTIAPARMKTIADSSVKRWSMSRVWLCSRSWPLFGATL